MLLYFKESDFNFFLSKLSEIFNFQIPLSQRWPNSDYKCSFFEPINRDHLAQPPHQGLTPHRHLRSQQTSCNRWPEDRLWVTSRQWCQQLTLWLPSHLLCSLSHLDFLKEVRVFVFFILLSEQSLEDEISNMIKSFFFSPPKKNHRMIYDWCPSVSVLKGYVSRLSVYELLDLENAITVKTIYFEFNIKSRLAFWIQVTPSKRG